MQPGHRSTRIHAGSGTTTHSNDHEGAMATSNDPSKKGMNPPLNPAQGNPSPPPDDDESESGVSTNARTQPIIKPKVNSDE